ncbi:hypothetical protein [Marinoscillum pacificum]|uniref:hypothetical protein n=1 Tax=Marinoscillum pacificum TaxID=392723 RepID=UPI0021586327|nr:hypothetical protein [Marinoscillum pacificum]
MATLMGLLVGITSITVSSSPLPIAIQQNADTEKSDESKESDVSLKAFDAITSSVQVSLEQSFILIDVLPDLEEVKEEYSEVVENFPSPNKALKILFRRIISPNAP